MRTWVSRRFGPYRAGVSFGPEDFKRRRGRPPRLATLASSTVRPVSYYGVTLSVPAIEEEREHVYHPVRDAWTIVTTLVWLLIHGIFWTVIVAAIIAGFGIVLISAMLRV